MSVCKIFADDASLFSKSLDINKSAGTLNRDSDEVSECCTPVYRTPFFPFLLHEKDAL